MDNKQEPTIEQLKAERIEALASLAALFGGQLEHYGRLELQITFKGDTDHDQWFPPESDMADEELDQMLGIDEREPTKEWTPPTDKDGHRIVKEPDSLPALVAQILTLLHPKVKAVFGSSAIYSILSTAASAYGREGSSVEEKINGMSFPLAAQAWIISKRIFVTNHMNDLRRMIDLLMRGDESAAATMNAGQPLSFEGITDKDKKEVTEYCQFIIAQNAEPSSDSSADQTVSGPEAADQALREITEIQSSGNIVLLQSKVARNMLAIARGKGVAKIDVGTEDCPIEVRAEIMGRNGEKSVELTRVDYDVMETVGQIVQENGKGIIITPSQIYQKTAPSNSNYHPSQQTINEIVASMDKLLFTPATLDFTQQIEKNTKLKAKKNKGELKGAIEGNLISGLHLKEYSAAYKGQTVRHSFLIYDMPMLYYYSQTIGHIVTIPGYLLTGNSPKATKKAQKQEPTQQRVTLKELGLQRYLLERIEYFKKLKKKQADKNWQRKIYKKDYSYQMSFNTIAEEIDYEITPKKQRMLREQTYEFLQKQVELGNIKRCEYYYKGRALSGVTIIL